MRQTETDADADRRSLDGTHIEGERDGGSSARQGGVGALHAAVGNQAVRDLHESGELQAKLDVSQPGDATEREAERVADEVLAPQSTAGEPPKLRRSADGNGESVSGDDERRLRSSLSGGKALPDSTRSFFEARFGRDFSDVRVHTGPEADEAASSIGAEAFTLGSDVAFASGNYRPETPAGKRLIAHELAHVVQGGNAVGRQTNAMMPPEGLGGGGEEEGSRVSLPNVQEMSTWEKAQFLADLTSAGGAMGGPIIAGTLLNLYTMSQVFGYTAAVGVGGAGSFAAGGGASAGIVFFPSGQIGVYGTAAGEVGAVVGAGVELEYTVVFGGKDEFTGDVIAYNAGISLAASGHGTVLMSPDTGEIVGLSIDAGVGIGATVLEFSASYEGTTAYTGTE